MSDWTLIDHLIAWGAPIAYITIWAIVTWWRIRSARNARRREYAAEREHRRVIAQRQRLADDAEYRSRLDRYVRDGFLSQAAADEMTEDA